jgi:lysophospholipase L1-like esterase
MRRHPFLVLATGFGLALMTASAAASPSVATPGGRPEPAVYLALGDSVAAGVGATPDASNGYVSVLYGTLTAARPCGQGQALGCRLDLVNLAQPGATTATLLADQLPTAVDLIAARRDTPTPVDDVGLITIDIGGNDVFTPIVSACAPDPQSPTCLSTIAAQLRQVDVNYDRMLATLRAAAGEDTTIAVMTYYNPLPGCQLAGLAPLAQLVLEGGGPVPAGLNDIIRNRAAQYGAEVAETAPVIGIEDLVGGTDCLHPDNSGHADIAAAFADVVDVHAVIGPPGRR